MLPSVEWIEEHGLTARGKTELIKYLEGDRLTRAEAMDAMCYTCMGYFIDGRQDCSMEKSCPMYGYMVYGTAKKKNKRVMTEEQKAVVRRRFQGGKG